MERIGYDIINMNKEIFTGLWNVVLSLGVAEL